jgi:hypothetical protein
MQFLAQKKNFKMEIRQKLTGNILLCDFSQHGSAAFLCKPKQWRHSTKMKFWAKFFKKLMKIKQVLTSFSLVWPFPARICWVFLQTKTMEGQIGEGLGDDLRLERRRDRVEEGCSQNWRLTLASYTLVVFAKFWNGVVVGKRRERGTVWGRMN